MKIKNKNVQMLDYLEVDKNLYDRSCVLTVKITYCKNENKVEKIKKYYSKYGDEWYELPKVKRCSSKKLEHILSNMAARQDIINEINDKKPDLLLTEEEKKIKDIVE